MNMIMTRQIYISVIILLSGISLRAEISLPGIFDNSMVIQRDQPVSVWGWADPNEEYITLQFKSQTYQGIVGQDGRWKIALDTLQASGVPSEMILKGKHSTLKLNNILVGEVWLCSGQSNMEYSMQNMEKTKRATDPHIEIYRKELDSANNDQIRLFRVNKRTVNKETLSDGWKTSDGKTLYNFSLVAYYFGKKLQQELNVPVGLIQSTWGGTRIELWIPQEAAEKAGTLFQMIDGRPMIDGCTVGKNYNGMIGPIAPFGIRGVLWYQGESNIIECNDSLRYADKMRLLVSGWRDAWQNSVMPFYFVQLAPYRYSARNDRVSHTPENLPKFWEAQALAVEIPHTDMVTITDLVENVNDIHPSNKWEVGQRLSDLALVKVYGKKDRIVSGPVFESMEIQYDKCVLSFKCLGSGLISRDGKDLTHFEIADEEGVFYSAKAVIENDKIVVSAPEVKQPCAVRFGWHETARPNLCNREGLPARPFRFHK